MWHGGCAVAAAAAVDHKFKSNSITYRVSSFRFFL